MKRTLLRNIVATAAVLLAASLVALAGPDEKFISVDKLPSAAQKFIKQHYPTEGVISVQKDIDEDKDYEVMFKNGTHLEFDHSGKLKELHVGKDGTLPGTLSALLPASIGAYIKDNYPGATIISLEPDGKGWKIGISGKDIELIFDKKGNYLGADD